MRETRDIMGMPVSLEIASSYATSEDYETIFGYFRSVDERFSPYKEGSEVSRFNRGELAPEALSSDFLDILARARETDARTAGYFDIRHPNGTLDPSGLVKGWTIQNAAGILRANGWHDFYLEAGGDIQVSGRDPQGGAWSLGIRNPLTGEGIVKVLYPRGKGVATSGIYLRGKHIYNPHTGRSADAYTSFTVVGPNVYEADRFATAAFAMGEQGIRFIEETDGLEAYAIDAPGIATMTSGFSAYTTP